MTTPFLSVPIFYYPSAPSGQLFTYIANSTTPQVTYSDAAGSVPNTNPVILDTTGAAIVRLGADLAYDFVLKDQTGTTTIWTANNYTQPLFSSDITQTTIAALLYPQTAAETAAGVTPTHLIYPPGTIDRYGTNTTPGTTDMGPALNQAISVALAASGSGQGGLPIRFNEGAYSIATKPTFGASTANIIPIDIGGKGIGTQLINNLTASSSPLFDMTAKNGWWLHDFLMCGNSAHKNIGICVNFTGSAEAIEWRISRITSMMAGVGFQIANTNTGVIEGCRHWPGNNPVLIVTQAVTNSDISHGLYLTGSFVHNVSIYDFCCPPNSNYNATNRGIKCDAGFSFGVNIVAPLVQTLSGNNNEVGIEYNCSGSAAGLKISAPYLEGTIISLTSVSQSSIISAVDGGVGGALVLTNGTRENTFIGVNLGMLDITDNTCWGNTFINCLAHGPVAWSATVPYVAGNYVSNSGINYKCILANTNQTPPNATYWVVITAFNDATEGNNLSAQPTRLIGCSLQGFSTGIPDLGGKWRKLLAQSSTIAPDTYAANTNVVRVLTNAAITMSAPLHPRNGQEVEFTFRNESGGAMGTITWTGYSTAGWANPANGFNRSICFQYDSDFAQWRQKWVGAVDIPN